MKNLSKNLQTKENIVQMDLEGEKKSPLRFLLIYICIFLLGITALLVTITILVRRHDKQLSYEICNLQTEKMNSSIRYMTETTYDMANLFAVKDNISWEEEYQELLKTTKHSKYIGIGLIDEKRNIYASEIEKEEFKKYNLLQFTYKSGNISLSEPYRSSSTGLMVFTVFARINNNTLEDEPEESYRFVFMTYPLSEIQDMADTNTAYQDIEIWLVESDTENAILCYGANTHSIGTWQNLRLLKKNVKTSDQEAYDKWKFKMHAGVNTASLTYSHNGTIYTQVFKAIDSMNHWYFVVKSPNTILATTSQELLIIVLIFFLIFAVASGIFVVSLYQKERSEKEVLRNLSTRDPLTNVLNRRAFEYNINWYMKHASKTNGAFIFFDIDHFKEINDTFGHETGDHILIEFSMLLREIFKEDSYLGRYGGDEFVLFIKDYKQKSVLTTKLMLLQDSCLTIFPTEDATNLGTLCLSFSAGIAQFPKDGQTLSELTSCADKALYQVKKKGRNGYLWYNKKDQ